MDLRVVIGLYLLVDVVLCKFGSIDDVLLLLKDLQVEKENLIGTSADEGKLLQFIDSVRMAKMKTGIQIIFVDKFVGFL